MNRLIAFVFGTTALLSAGPAVADIDVLSVTFSCEDGAQVPVSYFNSSDGTGAAAMVIDGDLIAMKQTPSGSGIRYESVDTDGTYYLRSKGWDATITHQANSDTAPERVLFKDCTSK